MPPQLVRVSRQDWGVLSSTEQFIANRISDPALGKTSIHVHHTAAIDIDDDTPNRWDFDEAAAYMRRLQWSRPDLGPLPYSENYATNEDLSIVWILEGRGWTKRGAHTADYNATGVGLGALANFDKPDVEAAKAVLYAMQVRVAEQRENGFPNLGSRKNPNGWNAWGHRDTSTKTCPGHSLYPLLAEFKLDLEDDMTLKNTLIDLAFAAGWAEPDTQEAREYWYGVDPAKPEWNNMRNAIIRGGLSLRDIGDGGATIEEIKGLIRATGHVI